MLVSAGAQAAVSGGGVVAGSFTGWISRGDLGRGTVILVILVRRGGIRKGAVAYRRTSHYSERITDY
jgi:hypothetical protein